MPESTAGGDSWLRGRLLRIKMAGKTKMPFLDRRLPDLSQYDHHLLDPSPFDRLPLDSHLANSGLL